MNNKKLNPAYILLIIFAVTAFLLISPSLIPNGLKEESEDNKEIMEVKVYYANLSLNKSQDCSLVYPVSRKIERTEAVATVSLSELFKGPTEIEKGEGYSSFFSKETEGILKSVKVLDKTAYVDLTDIRKIIPNASSSCGGSQLLSQMESTLKQFPTVERVIFAIDGDPGPFYEWLQLGCSLENNNCDKSPFSNK